MLHGADYNPDQWLGYEGIVDEDIRLMKLSGCNTMSVGIFSWATLEPQEGVYDFSFLDDIMEKFEKNHINAILATPSGARPAWMSQAHPEVLRVNSDRTKNLHGFRHNHCYTSPYYRRKTREINRLLAERYGSHPSLIAWHISNEYGGECHCELCQAAFRAWLKERYGGDLDKLNHAYWARFWSHTYTSWDQIESPSPLGEQAVHGLNLDWKRFVTYQTRDFIKNEIAPLKALTPDIPVTTNFMGNYTGLDYFKLKDVVDVVSWDNYPVWHAGDDVKTACDTAFLHDLYRSVKGGQPFMMMESTPSHVNWHEVNKLKRPQMHRLSSLQAVAHGSDTVQYFQWRKSRGSSEKLHGAVVDHCGHEHTRVFREVADLGKTLGKLDEIVGTRVDAKVAVIYDWENHWAVDDMQGMGRHTKKYLETCKNHYEAFWKRGIHVDVIDTDCSFCGYQLMVAPMLYMLKPGVADKIKQFIRDGGQFVATYATGWVNASDLCFLGGFPGDGLMEVFGIWAEELDSLYQQDRNTVQTISGKQYQAIDFCEVIHANQAEVLGKYQQDFYAGMPAVTYHSYGAGGAYYIAFRDNGVFLDDFYGDLIEKLHLESALSHAMPEGVTAHTRESEESRYTFIENYNKDKVHVTLPGHSYTNVETGQVIQDGVELPGYGCLILKSKK